MNKSKIHGCLGVWRRQHEAAGGIASMLIGLRRNWVVVEEGGDKGRFLGHNGEQSV